MKFSINWLQEHLEQPLDSQSLASALIMGGFEVESLQPAAGPFSGVIVGVIESESPHPDAARLHCCRVKLGRGEAVPIVCGGVNVRPGLKVAVATVGAHLPGDITIKAAILRGQPSQGMICSAQELGLGEAEEGHIIELPKDAPIGENLSDYLGLDDEIMDLAIPPNRGDCLSIKGLARESSALLKVNTRRGQWAAITAAVPDVLPVKVVEQQRCPRYLGRVIRQIRQPVQTPLWMVESLRRSGLRSIHPVVDVTNYVMIEMGQPLHAFDLRNIHQKIEVRLAKPDETLTLLDGKSLKLTTNDLVIADHQQALALAGIMGGAASGVNDTTEDLFIESAFFAPIPLSLSARRHNLQTDASYRFARGVDSQLASQALERATQLLLEITGGKPGPVIEVVQADLLPKPPTILLRKSQIPRLLGLDFSDEQVEEILTSLGMKFTPAPSEEGKSAGWEVLPPGYRFDVIAEIDLIEELGRLRGYQAIPLQTLATSVRMPSHSEKVISGQRILNVMLDRGYSEAITYSFVNPRWQEWLDPQHTPLRLSNPISSEMSVMRTSLWPGLLQALQYNQNRQIARVRLFETGLCFFPPLEKPLQVMMLAGVACGSAQPEQWGIPVRPLDFFDLKADVEALLSLTKADDYTWDTCASPVLHPGQSAQLVYKKEIIGRLGALHPLIVEKAGLTGPVYVFELNYNFINERQIPHFKNISKFPGVRRDIALTLQQDIPAGEIKKFIIDKAGKLLHNMQIFDIYQGQNIEKGQKSIAIGLTFQDAARTLKDQEIQEVVENLISNLEEKFNAKLRV